MNDARVRNLGLAFAVACAAVLAACAQAAPRNAPSPTLPAPQATETLAPPPPTPTPTQTLPAATPTVTQEPSTPEPSPTATPQAATPSPTSTPTITPPGSPTAIPVSNVKTYTLTLEIEGLSDESIVRGDSIVARGQTSPDAIVSINGVIVPVDENGRFEVPMMLDPGPNVIEVVASDLDGNQVSTVLAVVSLPEETA